MELLLPNDFTGNGFRFKIWKFSFCLGRVGNVGASVTSDGKWSEILLKLGSTACNNRAISRVCYR